MQVRFIPIIFFLFGSFFSINAQQLVINEFSNGSSGSNEEFIELAVQGPPGTAVDIRGWIIDDNSGFWACGSGLGIAAGHIRFANINNWRCVPTGSIILIYNNLDKHPSITLPDDPTDANRNCVYILPANSPGMFEFQTTNPSTTSCTDFSGGLMANNAMTWNTISLNNTSDGITIVNPTNLAAPVHQVAYGMNIPAGTRPSVHFNMAGGATGFRFQNLTNDNWNTQANWTFTSNPLLDDSPGFPNSPQNALWLENMKLQIIANPDTGCAPLLVTLSTNTSILNRLWDFGDGSLPVGGTFPAPHNYATGTHYANLTVTDANGCQLRDTTVVVVGNVGFAFAFNDTICPGDTAQLFAFGGGGNAVYQWYDSVAAGNLIATNDTLTILGLTSDTTFYLTLDTAGLCGPSSRVGINVVVRQPNILPMAMNDTICPGDTARFIAFGSGMGATYRWYDSLMNGNQLFVGDTFQVLNLMNDTTFYVGSGDGSACANNSRIPVTIRVRLQNLVPQALNDTICPGDTARLIASGGDMDDLYRWYDASSGGTLIFTGDTLEVLNLTSDTTFYVTTGDGTNCTDNTRIPARVTVRTSNILPQTLNDTICLGDTARLIAFGSGAGAIYTWFSAASGGMGISTNDTLSLFNISSDTTFYVATGDGSGCTDSTRIPARIVIRIPANLPPQALNDTICPNDTARLIAFGSGVNVSYRWFDVMMNGNQIHRGDTLTVFGITSDTTFYVSSDDSTGCIDETRIAVRIVVNQPMNIVPTTQNDTICAGDPLAILSAMGAGPMATYTWFDAPMGGNIVSTSPSVIFNNLTSDTTLYVTSGDGTNCTNNTRVPVTVIVSNLSNNPPTTLNDTICLGEIAILNAFNGGAGVTYSWYDSLTGGSLVSIGTSLALPNISQTTTFYVSSGDGTNCTDNTRIPATIFVRDTVGASFDCSPDTLIQQNQEIRFTYTGNPASQLNWYFEGFGGPFLTGNEVLYTFPDTGLVMVHLIAQNAAGCLDTVSKTIRVMEANPNTIFVPSAFSPNDDLINDVFLAKGNNIQSFRMEIYDRWGSLIFKSNNINEGWDGTVDGIPVQSGAYVYQVVARFNDFINTQLKRKGVVHVMK